LTLIAHFQDLSKVDTLVLVRVLDLNKTRTTLDKKMFLSRYECSFQEFLWTGETSDTYLSLTKIL
jgi:hypothetical protein